MAVQAFSSDDNSHWFHTQMRERRAMDYLIDKHGYKAPTHTEHYLSGSPVFVLKKESGSQTRYVHSWEEAVELANSLQREAGDIT